MNVIIWYLSKESERFINQLYIKYWYSLKGFSLTGRMLFLGILFFYLLIRPNQSSSKKEGRRKLALTNVDEFPIQSSPSRGALKYSFSEKATKFCAICLMVLTFT
jgi:hypothetical protein